MSGIISPVVLVLVLGVGLLVPACSRQDSSNRAAVAQFEQAFELKPGSSPPQDQSPSGLAATAASAMRAGDWSKAMAALDVLRNTPGVNGDQGMAISRAAAAVYDKLTARAAKGDQDAKQVLNALSKEQGGR